MNTNIQTFKKWDYDLYFFQYKNVETTNNVEYFHAHEGLELLYIHEGTGTVIVNDRLHPIVPRTLILYKPFQLHHLNIQVPPPYVRSLLKIRTSFLDQYAHFLPYTYTFLSELLTRPMDRQVFYLDDEQDDEITHEFRHAKQMLGASPNRMRKEAIMLFAWSLLASIRTIIQSAIDNRSEPAYVVKTGHINQVLQWIDNHFRRPFTLNEIAAELNFSPGYLCRLFRRQTGKTIVEYTTEKRMEHSRMLLHDRTVLLSAISEQSGFRSASYFIKAFKKKYNVTPHQYRIDSFRKGTS